MPKLRPIRGRQAAAQVVERDPVEGEPLETNTEKVEAQEDPAASLKAELETLRKANETYRTQIEQERQAKLDAIKQAQERDLEVNKLQERSMTSQQETLSAALAAAQGEAETAQRDIEMATQLGDGKAQAEAYRRLARAETKILTLEQGKEAIEREIKERPKYEPKPQQQDALDSTALPPLAKTWLREHPEYLHNPEKNAEIQYLHWKVVAEGLQPYSQPYFERMEERLGMRGSLEPEDDEELEVSEEEKPTQTRKIAYSAPPSREVPKASGQRDTGRITLTAAQKEAAKIAGVSEADYAVQLMKLREEKKLGNYGGQP